MKNILILVLVSIFSLSGVVYAKANDEEKEKGQIQVQEISEEMKIQVQDENRDEASKNKEEARVESQKNKNEALAESQKNKNFATETPEPEKNRSLERRSEVSDAVHSILESVDRNGGIGEQVRVIAQAQNEKYEEVEVLVEKIEKRSSFAKFFIGPDFNNIKKAKDSLKENKDKVEELESFKTQIKNKEDLDNIENHINTLKRVENEIAEILDREELGFSLFGWLSKLIK
jgi:hypothetical protein